MPDVAAIRETACRVAGVGLDLIYPRSCPQCGGPPEGDSFFCWDCLAGLQYVQPPFCSLCGDPVPGHIDHEYCCVYCSRRAPHFDQARSAVRYAGAIGLAVRTLKYHRATWLIPELTRLLDACFATHYGLLPFHAVCYVPLHKRKRRERGFNQAEALAVSWARARRLPVRHDALRRIRETGSQTHLTASQRASNVAGVFVVTDPRKVEGQRVVLIDDVMTTGATVSECARVLKGAGAESVHVLTVARG